MTELNDLSKMPFGKYAGTVMQDVPASYFHFLWTNGMDEQCSESNVAMYIKKNLHALQIENKDLIW